MQSIRDDTAAILPVHLYGRPFYVESRREEEVSCDTQYFISAVTRSSISYLAVQGQDSRKDSFEVEIMRARLRIETELVS